VHLAAIECGTAFSFMSTKTDDILAYGLFGGMAKIMTLLLMVMTLIIIRINDIIHSIPSALGTHEGAEKRHIKHCVCALCFVLKRTTDTVHRRLGVFYSKRSCVSSVFHTTYGTQDDALY